MRLRIPFVGPSYEARSISADAQRAINCYVEVDGNTPRAPLALYGTPGLLLRGTIGDGPVRAIVREGSFLYAVSGQQVYKIALIAGVYTPTSLGFIGTVSGPVSIASNGAQILIVDGTGGWIITTATGAFTSIVSAGFPTGVTRATYQDQYFIVTGNGTQKFYISKLADGLTWNALDFASAEGAPDVLVNCIAVHRELWLFGDTTVEIWLNTGNPAFPFERSGNTFMERGCAAADTVARIDNTLVWLGKDDRGGPVVWKANGYAPIRISTHALEKAMQNYGNFTDARAFSYQQEGHEFYVLTFTSDDHTWVYDATTGYWHERAWRDPATTALKRWRGACHVFFNQDNIVGDHTTGKIYALKLDTYTDDGNPIYRLRTAVPQESNQERLFFSFLQIDMETGTGGTISLRYSNDGGFTWSGVKDASAGAVGDYSARCIFRNLGSGRNRAWEIGTLSNAKFAVIGAVVEAQKGTS